MSGEGIMARLAHARSLGYCARGMRTWFAGREHTWEEFVTVGVPAEWLRESGDAMALRVAEAAEADPTLGQEA